ncbi:hypothetical protein H8D83_01240 [Candidatus Woesearchaeota archaeon]|nr:hypothetical protein [Candidatus Woesearchaeota archaeon]
MKFDLHLKLDFNLFPPLQTKKGTCDMSSTRNCPRCFGRGTDPNGNYDCKQCRGNGTIPASGSSTCPRCHGTTTDPSHGNMECKLCRGRGTY